MKVRFVPAPIRDTTTPRGVRRGPPPKTRAADVANHVSASYVSGGAHARVAAHGSTERANIRYDRAIRTVNGGAERDTCVDAFEVEILRVTTASVPDLDEESTPVPHRLPAISAAATVSAPKTRLLERRNRPPIRSRMHWRPSRDSEVDRLVCFDAVDRNFLRLVLPSCGDHVRDVIREGR